MIKWILFLVYILVTMYLAWLGKRLAGKKS